MVIATIERISGAVLAPITGYRKSEAGTLIQDSAIYYSNGLLCETSLHIASSPQHLNVPGPFPSRVARQIQGTHIYGGILIGHFGHFIVEGLSRLWAVRREPPVKSIVFVRGLGIPLLNQRHAIPDYAAELFGLLGLGAPVALHDGPVQFEQLCVPTQLFGYHCMRGHPLFHSFVHKLRQVCRRSEFVSSKLYVSRSKLEGNVTGGILCESVIEDNLTRYGYGIFHPQDFSIDEQIGLYNHARQLIFAEGSAIHLFGLVARQSQKIALIRRRGINAFPIEQLGGFARCGVSDLNCIKNYYLHANTSTCEVDFAELGKELERLEFIPHRRFWRTPTRAELAQQAETLGIELRNDEPRQANQGATVVRD